MSAQRTLFSPDPELMLRYGDVPVYFERWPPACEAVAHGLCCEERFICDGAGYHFLWYNRAIYLTR